MKMLLIVCPFMGLHAQHAPAVEKKVARSRITAAQNVGMMLQPTATAPGEVKIPEAYILEKMRRRFYKRYKVTAAPAWYHLDKKTFMADFTHEGTRVKTFFSRKGNYLYTMRYGGAKNLPRDVYQLVRTTYYDHSIGVVVEVQMSARNIWFINLEGDANYITARVEGNVIEEFKEYQKQEGTSKLQAKGGWKR